jgi:transcriptional regulator with XRE-family HTH domain
MPEIVWERNGTLNRQLAALLIEERKARKLCQQELARKLHQHQSLISRLESGDRRIDVCEFLTLAAVIGFDPNVVLRKIQGVARNGNRVAKSKKPKHGVGPTFVCEFSDGTITRMSVSTSLARLDWDRGERLSIAAYQSRLRAQYRKLNGKPCPVDLIPVPPAIVSARFERDGVMLAQRNGGGVA